MVRHRACLVDIFDTVLTCDFSVHATELPALAGVSPDLWAAAFVELIPALNDGTLSMGAAYGRIVESCGRRPDDELVSRLVDRDRELIIEMAHVFDDVAPFLETLREWGVAAAFVSNCAESVRYLLEHSGLADLVDCIVLSCEVKSVKPQPKIFERALASLDVPAEAAFSVDDRPSYCDGARTLGISAVTISRPGIDRHEHADSGPTVSSLSGVLSLL